MLRRFTFLFSCLFLSATLLALAIRSWAQTAAPRTATLSTDKDDIGGRVRSSKGPEAGVWVIAETTELKTKFARIVVTDNLGQFVIPDLPSANYKLWVRGYGLVDSKPILAKPGSMINLTAVIAPSARRAADYYPSNYWYSLLEVPGPNEFPGTGPQGNGISPGMKDQAQWISELKTGRVGCEACHQIGDPSTREIPKSLGTFSNSVSAWDRRVRSGQDGPQMYSLLNLFGRERALKQFAEWTDRIAAGEYPKEPPPRPQGVERNLVVTLYDWAQPTKYIHDAVSTDKRNPTVNAYGPIYGPNEVSSDFISVLDPTKMEATELVLPVPDSAMPYQTPQKFEFPWTYYGNEVLWNSRTAPHTSVLDKQGRVWTAAAVRSPATPDFCRQGSSHPSAKLFPMERSSRHASMWDPKTRTFTSIETCFPTQHLQFGEDANDTLWFSSGLGGDVVGWLNTKMFDQTHDTQKSQGWTPLILDTNGNGKQDAWVEPDQQVDPAKDKRVRAPFYSVVTNPVDGAVWGSYVAFPGALVRLTLGANPPMTALAEIYEPPWKNPNAPVQGFTPRGIDVDRNGVIWTNLSGSGHMASFDRRKCRVLNGPAATGQHCPEGWTLYPMQGPSFRGAVQGGNADGSYFVWVDQFGTLGLGNNLPMLSGNGSDSIQILMPDRSWLTFRVPYPMGYYAKGFDGRIDDPNTGWKGRGLWSTYDERSLTHIEGGKGTYSKVVKFQIRPDPLAH